MRAEGTDLDSEVHGYRGGMPSGCRETIEQRIGGRHFVEVHGLRIKLSREAFDIAFSDPNFSAFEAHTYDEIVKPLNHCNGLAQLGSCQAGRVIFDVPRPSVDLGHNDDLDQVGSLQGKRLIIFILLYLPLPGMTAA